MTDSVNDARATEEVVGDDPPVSDSATGGAPNDGTAHVPSSEAGDEQQVHDDQVATASAAAAAVAARLMASHGQAPYAGGEGGEGNSNHKRAREDDSFADAEDGPEKKRAPNSMHGEGLQGGDPSAADPPNIFTGAPEGVGSGGDPAEANMITESFEVPANMVGKLIGRGGETIRNLQVSTDTRIQVDHSGEGPTKRIVISGYTADQVARAKAAVLALDAEETNRTVECPVGVVGRIIGRGGETIRALQSASEAHITVNQDFPPDQPRQIMIQGKPEACERAVLMVNELIHGEPGSAQAIIQRVCQQHGIGKSEVMTAPKMIVGRIIGRGGETIKQIQKATGATVQIDQAGDPCRISLAGQPAAVEQAKNYITEIINGGDPFAAGFGGPPGYGAPGGGYGAGYGAAPYGGAGGYPGAYGGYPAAGYGGFAGGGYPAAYPGAYGGYPAADPYAQAAAYGGGAQFPGAGGMGGAGGGDYGAAAGGGALAATGAGTYGASGAEGVSTGPAAGGAWQEYHDDQGRPYYYNASTGVTQWEKPADF